MTWMVYGATGHTGKLVAELAVARGETPVLAGRSESVREIADALLLEHRVFGLDDPETVAKGLQGIDVVAHCAGPFSATSKPMVDACLTAGAHYLDITGEIDVFEAIYARDQEAKDERIVLLPGSGFDVVPTDCVAAVLAEAMPDAVELDLAFAAEVKLGPGTIKTAIEGAGQGGRARVDGRLRQVPIGHKRVYAAFPSGTRRATSIPWGDVASAYRSTGIPNITTYTVVPMGGLLRYGQVVTGPVMRVPLAQRFAQRAVDRFVPRGVGMDEPGRSQVWGRVRNAAGEELTMTLEGPNGLPLTADAVVTIATRLDRQDLPPGAHTPSTAFGARFAGELDDVTLGDPV